MLLRKRINISSKLEQVQILTITPSEEHVKNLKFLSTLLERLENWCVMGILAKPNVRKGQQIPQNV